MLLPCALLDTLLFLSAPGVLVVPLLLGALSLLTLGRPLLLVSVLLPVILVLPLLSMLPLLALLLPLLRLLGSLLFSVYLPMLLRMLLLGLALLLLGMVLLLLLLRIDRTTDSEKQSQNGGIGHFKYFHNVLPPLLLGTRALAQASCRCVDRVANGFTRY